VVPVARFRVGEVALTRVPYFDIALDPSVVSLTVDEIESVDWSRPTWASADGQVLVGQAAWVIASEGRVIVVDPCATADQFLRSGPEAIGHQEAVLGAMHDAGIPPDRVDVVVLSHLDGIGMAAVVEPDGGWAPAFPNARVVMTSAELEWLAGGARAEGLDALNALLAQGVVDGVDDGHPLTGDVCLELTGAHTPGHAIVRIRSGGERATFLGHLALNPIHVATCSSLHLERARAAEVLDALVAEATAHEMLLVGPLWPFPGAGYATGNRILPAPV
jgi:glyoxylase-like metal-dependent hydrolase (beta-lactamase superfamily II)